VTSGLCSEGVRLPFPRLLFRLLTGAALVVIAAASGSAQAPAQTAADPVLVQRFAAASTDEARAALLKDYPQLADQLHRTALSTFGSTMVQRRELTAGEGAFRSLLWLAGVMRSETVRAGALGGLGSVEGQRGNLVQAHTFLQEAQALADASGDAAVQQPIYNAIGIVQRRMGDYERATASFDRSLALAQQLKRDDMIGRVYNNIGTMHLSRARLDLALEFFNRSLEYKVDDGGRGTSDMANTLNNIGAVYEELGDYARALPLFVRARDLLEKINASAGAITALGNIGHARAAMGQTDLAREAFQEALKRAETAGDGNAVATILHNLGNLVRDDGDMEEAEAFHRRSLALREEGKDAAGLAESRAELTRILLTQGRVDEAEKEGVLATSLAMSAGQLGQLARAQLYLGQVYERQGRLDLALATFEGGVATSEALREATPPGERARQIFLDQRLGPYYSVAAIHAKAGRGEQGLLAIERVRARTLLDLLGAGRQPRRALTDAEREREQTLAAAALSASTQLMEAQQARRPNAAAVAALQETLRVARQEKEAFTTALYASRPELRIIRGDAPVITSRQMATILKPGTAAVEFVVEPSRVWVYLARPGPEGVEVLVKQLPLATTALQTLAQRFSSQVASRDLGFAETSSQLYAALLGPFDAELAQVQHLIVVPDSVLWRVPFQALQSPRGRFLIEERGVSYAPSLSAVAALDARRAGRAAPRPFMLALGDPATASASRLPEAAREVQALGKLYGVAQSAVFVDTAATEASFRASVNRASVVHIATHGVLDDNNPMYSHVKLADGPLEAWELLDLDLNVDLAVLSACQTASGVIGGGEGVVGLSWALFAAGASTAVVSQWEVDSASTTSLMIDFHERLLTRKAGDLTVSEALRQASVQLMRDSRFRHPFYWAGFVAIGIR